ncbi:MAG: hypothetical protein B6241_00975 [Spirochaetaceae bacterium 4572_59]|nr:MAG: hypothetical protein B6241_00975 [Spirochaetaceae bacterium 4572_59]
MLPILLFCFTPFICWGITGTSSERAAAAAVNPNYPVTPGDTYSISYSMEDITRTIQVIVDRNFLAQVPGFREFDVKDKTYYEFKAEVEDLFNSFYPGSVPVMTITNPGVFDILIKGEVQYSREAAAWSFERVSTLIDSVKTSYTSFRKIEIISRNGDSRFVDIYKSLRTGDMSQNPYVSFGDTIILYPYEKQISLEGEVRRPGTYQLTEEETLSDVITYQGGGFTSIAQKQEVQIKRPYNNSNNEGNTFYLNMEDPETNMELMDMDIVTIAQKTSYLPVVHFQGAIGTSTEGTSVSSKVNVTITEGERLSSVARKMENQFTKVSDLTRAYIVRSDGSNIPVNMEELLLSGRSSDDVILMDRDIIVVPFRQYFIYVTGSVMSPGAYPYIINKSWEYYISLAGGFNVDEHTGRKVKIYDVYGEKYKQKERILQPEDVVFAPRNHPMYWIGEYGTDVALIVSTLASSIVMYNFMANTDYNTPR